MKFEITLEEAEEFAAFLTHYEVFANETYNCRFTHPDDLYIDAIMKQGEL